MSWDQGEEGLEAVSMVSKSMRTTSVPTVKRGLREACVYSLITKKTPVSLGGYAEVDRNMGNMGSLQSASCQTD